MPVEGTSGLINTLLGKVFGTKNERVVKSLTPNVNAINALEPEIQKLTDAELRAKTDEFRHRIQERLSRFAGANGSGSAEADAAGADQEDDIDRVKRLEKEQYDALQEVLNEILVEAFAVVREAGRRVLNMRHFDVQLIGGMVLHHGKIAEMKTGEGKTLVATLPVLPECARRTRRPRGHRQRLPGQARLGMDGHGSTRFLGLTVGVIVHDLDDEERRDAYSADITYGTNNEFGFDYLRDNMKFDIDGLRAARAPLRHRRRSGFHPDRRSANPADHFRPERGIHRQVLQGQSHHSQAEQGEVIEGTAGEQVQYRRLRRRRKAPQHHCHRRGRGTRLKGCWHRQHLTTRRTWS